MNKVDVRVIQLFDAIKWSSDEFKRDLVKGTHILAGELDDLLNETIEALEPNMSELALEELQDNFSEYTPEDQNAVLDAVIGGYKALEVQELNIIFDDNALSHIVACDPDEIKKIVESLDSVANALYNLETDETLKIENEVKDIAKELVRLQMGLE